MQNTDMLTHALTILAHKGWEKTADASFGYEALDSLISRFKIPLEKANIDCSQLQEEWDDLVAYAKRYLNLTQDHHHVQWWKIFNSTDAHKWKYIWGLIELLFCLPMSNGRVERLFSLLKVIKTERWASLGVEKLDSLMRIASDGPSCSHWDPSGAVKLWQKDKMRRQVQDTRTTQKDSTPRGWSKQL